MNTANYKLSILLAMTFVTGLVDAVSFLGLGHVFTANMTGNVVFLGFAIGGAPDISIPRSLAALCCFSLGAIAGGRMGTVAARILALEAVLLCIAGALWFSPWKVAGVIAATALAMGMQNALARKLAVPDLTTTVLTLTITGLAADSSLAGGQNPRWPRRVMAIVAMLTGAASGAWIQRQSAPIALIGGSIVAALSAWAWSRLDGQGDNSQ